MADQVHAKTGRELEFWHQKSVTEKYLVFIEAHHTILIYWHNLPSQCLQRLELGMSLPCSRIDRGHGASVKTNKSTVLVCEKIAVEFELMQLTANKASRS